MLVNARNKAQVDRVVSKWPSIRSYPLYFNSSQVLYQNKKKMFQPRTRLNTKPISNLPTCYVSRLISTDIKISLAQYEPFASTFDPLTFKNDWLLIPPYGKTLNQIKRS